MTASQLISLRLINQQLVHPRFTNAQDLVSWMGAIQAQEYAMSCWAIALRVPGLTLSTVEDAFNRGEILRTHLLRPTWHFVAPEDIRWMQALAAPQVKSLNSYMHRQLGLDEKLFRRSNAILAKSLSGGNHLTREDLRAALRCGKIVAGGPRLAYLMMRAEIDGIICSGPRVGKQFTYALLDARVKPTPAICREQALARLAERYFRSRGPATVPDFANWSGLTLKDARQATASLPDDFNSAELSGKKYFFTGGGSHSGKSRPTFLMPEYDEYGMSYKDLGAMWAAMRSLLKGDKVRIGHSHRYCLVVEGRLAGWWQKRPEQQTGHRRSARASFPFSDESQKSNPSSQSVPCVYRFFGWVIDPKRASQISPLEKTR